MATRCNILIKDQEEGRIVLYRHYDGYPEGKSGVIDGLLQAQKYAWELPRFEASDFAAAIVRSMKTSGGEIYIDGALRRGEPDDALNHGDIDFFYIVKPSTDASTIEVEVVDFKPTSKVYTLKKDYAVLL